MEKICQVCGKEITSELDWFKRNGVLMCKDCADKHDSNVKNDNQQTKPNNLQPINNRENTIANIIKRIGVIVIVLGIISGLIIWGIIADQSSGAVGFVVCLVEIVMSFVSGMLFIGLSEIIYLLQHNVNNSSALLKLINPSDCVTNEEQSVEDNEKSVEIKPNVDIKKVIEEAIPNENQIQCPHCGHIQSKNISRCLSCSKMIIE